MPDHHRMLADSLGHLVPIVAKRSRAEAHSICEQALKAARRADELASNADSQRVLAELTGLLARLAD